ncbi:MAG: 2-oxo acid dehydrogenase subunit E2 [Desulfuromonadales bacterium]|nr:2-oxo acid dehydrogenase subunit E2 [Desulfuromonadales bacterium]
MKEITMPKLSDTMTEGLFAGWRKNIGDRIERGDIIAEVETDKAVMELESFATGILLKTFATGGETVPVGTVLGLIGEVGESAETTQAVPSTPAVAEAAAVLETQAAVETPTVTETPAAAEIPAASEVVTPIPATPVPAAPVPPAETVNTEQHHDKASPMVRRMAREQGIDLDLVQGSGPEGRITQEDLSGFPAGHQKAAAPSQPAAAPVAPAVAARETPSAASPMRQAIAAAVSQSWSTIPHFTVTVEICMEACREIVSELKSGDRHIGYNALLIKACAKVLERFPLLRSAHNAADTGINISIAVALPDGLLMPVIRKCQNLSAPEIEAEIARLIDKSRAGRLTSGELSGGSFSVSNLGMYGVDEFAALIMPGQVAILAVGAVTERPLVRNGQLAVAHTLRVTLSSDHRSIDGAYAASFLSELRTALEKPVSLLV